MIQENTVDEETETKATVEKVSPSERVSSERVSSERVSSELVRTETCQAMSTTVGKRAVNWETTMIESNNEVKLQLCIHQINSSFIKFIHHSFKLHSSSTLWRRVCILKFSPKLKSEALVYLHFQNLGMNKLRAIEKLMRIYYQWYKTTLNLCFMNTN